MQNDFLAVDFRAKIGAAEGFLAGQLDPDEMKRGVADVREAVFGANGEVRRSAGDEMNGQCFVLDLIAGRDGDSAAARANRAKTGECGGSDRGATTNGANQSRRILPDSRLEVGGEKLAD